MQKILLILVFVLAMDFTCLQVNAQVNSLYEQLVSVNPEWRKQLDVDSQFKQTESKSLNERELIQLHLIETLELLKKRDVSSLPLLLKENRKRNLEVLHQYLMAGVFPINTLHINRQPYFIDENNTYCAVGYLMKESGADNIAKDIQATQNYGYLKDIKHPKLMDWIRQSGLSIDELALIQPGYAGDWPSAIMEFHYNNTGTDVNEYIEIHESSGQTQGMPALKKVLFYDHTGTLYKTLTVSQMQYYVANGGLAYYYLFPATEHFADSGKIELKGTDFPSVEVLLSSTIYTSSSVQVFDYLQDPNNPTIKLFNVGESEATPVGTSLTYCGFYYDNNWNLQSVASTIGTQNPCTIMPIGLGNFSFTNQDKKIILHWETLSETNNKLFSIERSSNGVEFQEIGNVPGAINSNIARQYTYTDNKPNYINHYRLKQIDRDGKYTYSKILYAKVEEASPLELQQNVVVSNLQYQVSSSQIGITIEVFDYYGRKTYTTSVKSGVQHINVSGWSAGEYVIRLLTRDGQVYSQRFIKH